MRTTKEVAELLAYRADELTLPQHVVQNEVGEPVFLLIICFRHVRDRRCSELGHLRRDEGVESPVRHRHGETVLIRRVASRAGMLSRKIADRPILNSIPTTLTQMYRESA